ncbi:MAG: glycoside hydrolase family 15 protein [Cellulomonas sp.]
MDGGSVPEERPLTLPGYPGGGAVSGNWVTRQFQLDVPGEALQLFTAAADLDLLDNDVIAAAHIAVDVIEKRWEAPDAGIWELDDQWWTHSRLACVAGLRRAATIRSLGGPDRLGRLAHTILAETSRRCLNRAGYWQRHPSDPRVDAALLLGAVRGAVAADDPRTLATLAEVRKRRSSGGYVYRFQHDAAPLGTAEGAFTLCGFVLSLAEAQQGNISAALTVFERNRATSGPPGLFAEEYDTTQRQLRGNLPRLSSTPCSSRPRWSWAEREVHRRESSTTVDSPAPRPPLTAVSAGERRASTPRLDERRCC